MFVAAPRRASSVVCPLSGAKSLGLGGGEDCSPAELTFERQWSWRGCRRVAVGDGAVIQVGADGCDCSREPGKERTGYAPG